MTRVWRKAVCCAATSIALAAVGMARAETATAAGPSQTDAPVPPPAWKARLPAEPAVVFRGAVSFDEAGQGSGAMMYPAPNLIGALAGVLTHGILVDVTRSRQKAELQAKADEVLTPYRAVLDGYTARDLFARALARTTRAGAGELIDAAAAAPAERVVSMAPVFVLAQDRRSLLLETAVLVTTPGSTATDAAPTVIRVVSDGWKPAREGDDPAGHWAASEGAALKELSAELLAHALDMVAIAGRAAAQESEPPFKTFRYQDGPVERFERGQLVSEGCGRAVIKTLRGAWMSVPVRAAHAAGDAGCRPDAVQAAR